MKTILMIAAAAGLAVTCTGQLVPLPPPSYVEAVQVQPMALNSGPTHWENPQTLGAFRGISDGNNMRSISAFAPAGLTFGANMPSSARLAVDGLREGGVIRPIFLGESALWKNSFGYSRWGNPRSTPAFTIFNGIDGGASSSAPNVRFGDYCDLYVLFEANTELWFSAAGVADTHAPTSATEFGGLYLLFNPANSDPATGVNAMWGQSPLLVDTWLPWLGTYMPVPTFVVGFEDWRMDRGGDADYTDLVIGLQFYPSGGGPLTPLPLPVPEPAMAPALGALALLGILVVRLRARRRVAEATS